jgi:hypothetical protein
MTPVRLAAHAGLAQSLISAYESGRRQPTFPEAAASAERRQVHSIDDGEQLPDPRDTLQFVFATLDEDDSRSRD